MTDITPDGPILGDDLWDVARQLYDAGLPAREICEDLGLATATFWRRARQESWLRRDRRDSRAAAPEPLDMDAPVQDPTDAADKAWRRMTQALDAGRVVEAARWSRLHTELSVGHDRALSRTQKATREQLNRLNDTARLIQAQARAALSVRKVQEAEEDDDDW